jgi:P2-related tail formation protein
VLFLEDAKPESRHITRLDISLDTRVPAFYGCALTDGDVLDIYPWQPADIDIHVSAYQAVTDHTIDILDVYLNG